MNFFINLEALSCFFMTGVIWIVQLVHYPCFFLIDKMKFKSFTKFHQQKISLIVAPVMLIELLASIVLLIYYPDRHYFINYALILLLVGIWTTTMFICVPCHNNLYNKFNEYDLNRLIQTNWIRTILWTIRTILIFITLSYTKYP